LRNILETADFTNGILHSLTFPSSYDLQNRIAEITTQKEKIHEDTKEITEKSNVLSNEMKAKNSAVKDVEK
jgi:hypothetical protein